MPSEGKSDMDRIGLFSEMEYITVGDRYVSHYNRPFNEAASKKKQMLPGGTKVMSDLQPGYFEPHFIRTFEGEGYTNMNQLRRRYLLEETKKNLGKAFLPSSGEKKPSGLGSYYGTIGGPCPFFSGQAKVRDRYVAPGKNIYTNPGKKGTGYGYPNLTIGKQLSHSSDFYDASKDNLKKEREAHHSLLKGTAFKLNLYPKEYFDPNPYFLENPLPPLKKPEKTKRTGPPFKPTSPSKKPGGMKAGTFDPYPAHSNEPFGVKQLQTIKTKSGKIFHPPSGPKSRPISSIMATNIKKSLNAMNYKNANVISY
ncbi:UPF0602 protein C4orf47 homolog isoform X1 [Ornithorhynchus anatinus]|uniref:Cilia-and flagella-associated protein 96 n=1 Tax=Ornithorhynchus anatinus TaxID=9258 RepID=F6UC24_ORNAN|nr:UPF0602 protein C4orf47 homolog isoform X1 [Ornithorhynchus anatinus]XP_028932199.1 UPF0602 protein C4orf47 homolog isoform X1 [Ornithorhynchus anatinus]XP_039769746.1 UPF0602 protein C4orf47 homolog isoform X1 [Ornithorhynchus anatinus]